MQSNNRFSLGPLALVVAVAPLLVFYVVPLALVFVGSFIGNAELGARGRYVGLSNYTSLSPAADLYQPTLISCIFASGAVATQVPLAFAAALLTRHNAPALRRLRPFLLIPYFLPSVVVVTVWRFLTDPALGPLPEVFAALNLPVPDFRGEWLALPGMIFVATYEAFPFSYVILLARLLQVPHGLYEIANLDGANAWRQFTAITWPQIRLTLAVVIALRFIITWLKFDVPWLVYSSRAKGDWSDTLAVRIYRAAFEDIQYGSAYAISVCALIGAISIYGFTNLLRCFFGAHMGSQ